MDEVKISIGGGDEGEKKPAKKRGRPKKAVAKKAPAKKTVAETKTSSKSTSKAAPAKKSGGVWSTIIAVIVTAVVVGGSIYAWQSNNNDSAVTDVRQEARKVRMDFEQRMEQLKNKLTGVETENQKLKLTTKELEERVKLLDGAKKEYSNTDLKINFEYPALFGEVSLEFTEGLQGKKFLAKFSENDKLVFGGLSNDYKPTASTTKADFLEVFDVREDDGKYFLQSLTVDDEDYEFVPTKTLDAQNAKVLLVDQNSFVIDAESDGAVIEMGEDIGALISFDTETYRAISFLNKDTNTLPLESYEAMLASVEFLD